VPEAFRELVVTRAEGNPFFVEEVLATLIDRGVLVRSGAAWALHELPDGLALPDSVQAVLAARIDLLAPAEKDALQAAAVIGRTFWSGPVYDLLEGKEPDIRVLEDRDFIRRRSASTLQGEVEFAFKHALTREVAYESLTRARRATLHARFAEWLERTIGDEAAPLLAHHYAEAANPEHADLAWADEERLRELRARAVEWLKRSGELALSRYELEEAIALLARALEFGPTVEQQIDLYETLGRAHSFRFDGDAFWGAMEKALELCANQDRRAELYMLLVCETAGRAGMWKQMPDRELVAGWVRHALDLSEPGSLTHLRTLVGGFWFEAVDNETADRAAARLLEVGDSRAVVDAFDTRKVLAFRRGHYDQALRAATAEVRAAEQAGDPETLANALEGAMSVATLCGQIEEAEQRLKRYQQIVQRFSPHHRLHATAMELELEEIRADWQRVVELLPKTREVITENLETPCIRNPRSLLVSAAAVAAVGDHQTAQTLEAEANSLGMHGYDSILRAPRLRLALARDDLDTVRQLLASPATERRQPWIYLPNAIAFFDALVALGDRDRLEAEAEGIGKPGTVLEPFALHALGRVRGDERLIELAADRFETFGLTRLAEQTRGF
jgi:tetratricopeptide (TPR) repeat protein